jgi:hypothetical protein
LEYINAISNAEPIHLGQNKLNMALLEIYNNETSSINSLYTHNVIKFGYEFKDFIPDGKDNYTV